MSKTLPAEYYQFRADQPAVLATAKDGAARKFGGVPYTGRVIRHGYWGAVVFDLASTRANDPTPALINHDSDQRCGFATLRFTTDQIEIADGTLLNSPSGLSIAAESDAGFPWQMSVCIQPGSIEELGAGTSAIVNGQAIQGPASIWRNNLIREVSFTPTGVDELTSAAALSAAAFTPPKTESNAMSTPTVEDLQSQITMMKASVEAAETARQVAVSQLETSRKEIRKGAVQALFSTIGREFSEAAALPYLGMDDLTFSAIAADLKAVRPTANPNLFKAEAENGKDPGANGEEFSLDPSKIYAARRAKQ